MAIELHNHEERQQDISANTNSADLFRDLVSVPADRWHESRINQLLSGLIVAICVTVPGAAVLDRARLWCIQAWCGEHLANIAMFCSIPFWISVPAQLGFM